MNEGREQQAQRAGWQIPEWCKAAGFSVPKLYTIPAELQPKSVKVGARRIITETPAAYLERIAAAGGVPSRAKK